MNLEPLSAREALDDRLVQQAPAGQLFPRQALVFRDEEVRDVGLACGGGRLPDHGGLICKVHALWHVPRENQPSRFRRGLQDVAHGGGGALLVVSVAVLLPLGRIDDFARRALFRKVVLGCVYGVEGRVGDAVCVCVCCVFVLFVYICVVCAVARVPHTCVECAHTHVCAALLSYWPVKLSLAQPSQGSKALLQLVSSRAPHTVHGTRQLLAHASFSTPDTVGAHLFSETIDIGCPLGAARCER